MERRPRAEIRAGTVLFLIVVVLCAVILVIGEVPNLFKPTYGITVEFRDASGLVKGSDVELSGALIGKVMSDPITEIDAQEVAVRVKLNESVRIRSDARFTIESSGVFGDKFLKVSPQSVDSEMEDNPYIKDGDLLRGTQSPDLSVLINAAVPLIHTATHAAGELDDMVTRLNTKVLTPNTVENLHAILARLDDVGEASQKLMINSKDLMSDFKSKDSVVGKLLYDKEVRKNLSDFMANYKEHGAIFYSDDSSAQHTQVRSRPAWRARP